MMNSRIKWNKTWFKYSHIPTQNKNMKTIAYMWHHNNRDIIHIIHTTIQSWTAWSVRNWALLQYRTVQYSTVQCNTTQYNIIQYSIIYFWSGWFARDYIIASWCDNPCSWGNSGPNEIVRDWRIVVLGTVVKDVVRAVRLTAPVSEHD